MDSKYKQTSAWKREREADKLEEEGTREDQNLTESHSGCGPRRQSISRVVRLSFLPCPPHQDVKALWHSPLQLLQGDCDPQAVAQHVESSQNVCPLHHLPQRPALQHPRAEHVPGLLCQEADVHEDLGGQGIEGGVRGEQQLLGLYTPCSGSPQRPSTAHRVSRPGLVGCF